MKDLHNNIKTVRAFSPRAVSTDATTAGTIVDLQGFSSAEFVIASGTLTAGTFTVLIEDGDAANLSDASAVADAFLLGTEAQASFAATDDDVVKKIGYIGNKRYVRLSIVSASSANGLIGAVAVLSHPALAPVV